MTKKENFSQFLAGRECQPPAPPVAPQALGNEVCLAFTHRPDQAHHIEVVDAVFLHAEILVIEKLGHEPVKFDTWFM